MNPAPLPIRTFDREDEYFVVERGRLPHWLQAGTISFITWRTWDSIPREVLNAWLSVRAKLLRSHGIDPAAPDWRHEIQSLPGPVRAQVLNQLSQRWEDNLNACHGACVLRRAELATIVADSLSHFDGQRYVLLDYVIMPNHVHLMASYPTEDAVLAQCDSWKHFTATKLNRSLQRKGRFWEEDQFDHLVRCAEEFDRIRRYIGDNPAQARLKPGEFLHYSKPLPLYA